MKIGALLGKLAQKAGLDTTTDEWKVILALDTDLPAEAATKIDNGLLTVEAAKVNTEVMNAIKATTLAGADSKINTIIAEFGLIPGDDFKNSKNTYDKIGMLTKLAADAAKKAAGTDTKQTAGEFAAKEKEYNDQIKALKDTLTTKETEFATTRENDLADFEFQTILSGKDYALPKEMDSRLKVIMAKSAIQQELAKKGFTLKRTEAGMQIVNKEGTPAYGADNVALEPNTFFDGVLTQQKLLRINDPNAAVDQPGSGGAGDNRHIPSGQNPGNMAIANELMAGAKNLPA